MRRLRGHDGAILSTSFGFQKDELWTTGKDTTVKLWDIHTGQIKHSFTDHEDMVKSVVVINDTLSATAGYDGKVILWDCRAPSYIASLNHGSQVDAIALFPSTTMLCSVGAASMKVWNLGTHAETITAPSRHSRAVTAMEISTSGDHIWTYSLDGSVKVRDTSTWEVIQTFACDWPLTAMAVSGNTLITWDEQGSLICRQRRTVAHSPSTAVS